MRRMFVLGSALLLTTSSLARAAESEEPVPPPSNAAAPSEGAAVLPAPPVVSPAAPLQSPAEVEALPPSGPEPYTGWKRGVRAPIYVNMMLSAGAFIEDGSNRLTTRDSKVLEGFGGVFRIGAVLGQHHRLGARMQSFVRPTKKVLRDPPATTDSNEWGAVTFGFIGPEYLYTSDLGLYVGGSVGIAGAVSSTKVDNGDHHDDSHTERGSAGAAGMLSLGYEWRASKWFAMNAEVFGGLYHGVDDNEKSMNGGLFGGGFGVGF